MHLAMQYAGDRDSAKDIVQQSLVKVLEQRKLPSAGLKFWFLKIVRNTALDFIKQQKNQIALGSQVLQFRELQRSNTEVAANYEAEERRINSSKVIELALAELSIQHREIIILKDIQGFSYEQIAEILDLAKGTVMSRLHRARLALKKVVEKNVIKEDSIWEQKS